VSAEIGQFHVLGLAIPADLGLADIDDKSSTGITGPPGTLREQRPNLSGVLSDVNGEKRDQDNAGHNDSHGHEDRYQASG